MIYLFEHPETGEVKEVFQKITEDHFYIDEDGVTWNRVFTPTNFNVDGKINAFSSKDFVKATAKDGMTLGDMWSLSREMHEKRKDREGKDTVKEKHDAAYAKRHKGKKPPPLDNDFNKV